MKRTSYGIMFSAAKTCYVTEVGASAVVVVGLIEWLCVCVRVCVLRGTGCGDTRGLRGCHTGITHNYAVDVARFGTRVCHVDRRVSIRVAHVCHLCARRKLWCSTRLAHFVSRMCHMHRIAGTHVAHLCQIRGNMHRRSGTRASHMCRIRRTCGTLVAHMCHIIDLR